MMDSVETIAERLARADPSLTRAERQLAQFLLDNYPLSGLGSITRIADSAGVSAPTVVRMLRKIGFRGFPEFQAVLRAELEATLTDPIAKYDNLAGDAPEGHILNRFAESVTENIRQTLAQLRRGDFERCCELLADEDRGVYVVGGRITRTLSDYLFLHLQVMRRGVTLIPSNSNAWPHYMLDIREGDVLVVLDVRRYENSTLKLAEIAAERGARIILVTDQWRSPIHTLAERTLSCRIEVPSAWDSGITIMLLLESLLAGVQEMRWDITRDRMGELEAMFDRTRFFRKFT